MRSFIEFLVIALFFPIMGITILIFCVFIFPYNGMNMTSLIFSYLVFIGFFVLAYKVFKKDYIEIYRVIRSQECFLFLIVDNDKPTEIYVWARTIDIAFKKVKRKYPNCYINNITKVPYDNITLFK